MRDVRRIIRRLLRQDSAFGLFAFFTLTLGLWLAALIFGVADGLLLRPLPYRDAGAMTRIVFSNPAQLRPDRGLIETATQHVRALPSAESVALYEGVGLNVVLDGEALRVQGGLASAELFQVLDVRPSEGRLFTHDEAERGDDVVVIAERLRERAGWPRGAAAGRMIRVNGQPLQVLGVMPAGVAFPDTAQLWVPAGARHTAASSLSMVARARAGNVPALRTELATAAGHLVNEKGERGWTLRAMSLHPLVAEGVGPLLSLAIGASLLVLLVVSTNIAALMLARVTSREAEFAAMLAVGASRFHVMRLVVLEAGLLSGAAAVAALALAAWTLRLVPSLLPVAELPEWMSFGVNARMVGFTIAAAAAATVGTSLLPAWSLPRHDLLGALRAGVRTSTGGKIAGYQRRILVAQLLCATVLLIGGGTLVRAYLGLLRVDPGYDAAGVYMLETELPPAAYPSTQDRGRFFTEVLPALERSGSIAAAAVAGGTTTGRGGTQGTGSFEPVRPLGVDGAAAARVEQVVVSPGFFSVLRLPIRMGRTFAPTDTADVIIVNESFARQHWGDRSPLGEFVEVSLAGELRTLRIVGVAADVVDPVFAEAGAPATRPRVYLPLAAGISQGATVYARASAGSRGDVGRAMTAVIRQVDPDQPVWSVESLETFLSVSRAPVKWFGYVLAGCALLAGLVACVGIYGVAAYALGRRRREFGVRAALGASPAQLLRRGLRQGVAPAVVGVVLGVVGGVGFARILSSIMYAVAAVDLVVIGGSAIALGGAATVASLLPASRAAHATPAILLRDE